MTDTLTPKQRSHRMSLIRGKNTKPEVVVRKLVSSQGYRYRLHARNLPGCPDLVFSGLKKIIFVHGCFWHRHQGCPNNRLPKSRREFWLPKLNANRHRDTVAQRTLHKAGWKLLIVWECEIKDQETVLRRINKFLRDRASA